MLMKRFTFVAAIANLLFCYLPVSSSQDAFPSDPPRKNIFSASDLSKASSIREHRNCTADEFQCVKDGWCIDKRKICDSDYSDCDDHSDEMNCPCKPDHFQCEDKSICIPLSLKCDGIVQCADHSDENTSNCPTQTLQPTQEATITESSPFLSTTPPYLEENCQPDQFSCYDGACMDSSKRCDNVTDCKEGEDEEGCIRDTCINGFQCHDGSCIGASKKCDGNPDCSDYSDERDCGCTEGQFRCANGHCIPLQRFCDTFRDCLDNSDEQNCPSRTFSCLSNEFMCADQQHCIPTLRRCDGLPDCRDRSDEIGCPPRVECSSFEFQCKAHHHCIPLSRKCDSITDCRDGSDEENCPLIPTTPPIIVCRSDEFICRTNDQCIHLYDHCNGRIDCSDGSDEIGCSSDSVYGVQVLNLRTYPASQVAKVGEEVVFLCRDESNVRAKVTWKRGNDLLLPMGSRINVTEGRLEIPNIQMNHAGPYICVALNIHDGFAGIQSTVSLIVQDWPKITTSRPSCTEDQATCHSGECIPKNLVCDGKKDCIDGSDEYRCTPAGAECEPSEFRCANGRCIQKTWRCDSEDDCGDRSDEQNCHPNPPGSPCRYDEFRCFNSTQCIPKSFHCDYETDCTDGSDEIGCSDVMFIQNPPRNVELHVGEIFTISCKAVGIPIPEVVFRLNWRHVPPKCKITSVDGFGTLTCPYVEIGDGGAYSCEGINNRGHKFATDTILTVIAGPILPTDFNREPVRCPRGLFNNLANTTNDCITCFCFGVTSDCHSANLLTYQLPSRLFPVRIVNVFFDSRRAELNSKSIDLNPLQTSVKMLDSNSFKVQGFHNESLNTKSIYPYFALPESYLGNQLKSYGGYIKYRVRYEGNGQPVISPSIILSGNGHSLIHVGGPLSSGQEKQESIRIFYGSWFKLNRGGRIVPNEYFPRILASREEIMMTLAKLDNILLKIQFVESRRIDTTILNFKFDSAGTPNSGQGEAAYVEECACPDGYFGLSCENCAPGYQRVSGGPWLGQCRRPQEPAVCEPGTYGDPNRGCLPCPCPFTASPNKFSPTCFLDADRQPTCNACPIGYDGRRCEICSFGFVGNPLMPGSSCQRSPCDPAGSHSLTVDPVTGQCRCKENVVGPYCNQCKPNAFYLSPTNVFGCIKCFCMGVTRECFSSHLYRNQIVAAFVRDNQDFKIGGRWEVETVPSRNVNVDPIRREIIFSDFESTNQGAYYWSLPQRFLGNKVSSYGGALNYTLRYTPTPGSEFSKNNAPDVEIISEKNSIHLFYFERRITVEPNIPQTASIPFLEQYWQRMDGQIANREHLLMALSDLKAILIKATYTNSTQQVALLNVVLETAEDRNTGLRRAYEVEECRCPSGYRGTSCEECDVGYHRVDQGLYLGLCEPCNCYGHSRNCEAETGVCLNCANHTVGNNCERCEPGYGGNPTTGEACLPEGPCRCDARGSLSGECRNGQCACKVNVVGSTCDACRPGTFDLQTSHETGCLECYCSGATNECQSSNLFVTQIPMPILDENHGFTLTSNDRYSKVIKIGFKLNVGLNEIGYDYTTERGLQLFWSLPSVFTGNKITSYGGNLTWTQGSVAPANAIPNYDNDIVLYGDGIKIVWNNNLPIAANTNVTTSIKLHEDGFHRLTQSGTQKATRADILRILSSIEAILIRATYVSQTSFVFISDVSLDTAISQPFSNIRATQVEVCRCPYGYKGYSCESCIPGFYQVSSSTRYGKECRKCPCNDHEESCFLDTDTSISCNCLPGYTGAYCEVARSTSSPSTLSPTIVVNISEPLIQIVSTGSTVRYNCRAESIAKKPVVVKWSREGQPLPQGRAYDDGSGFFVIINSVASDSGTYVCDAYDGEVHVRQNVSIRVEDPAIPNVIVTPETPNSVLEFNVGDGVAINCEATGIPPPVIEWIKENGSPSYRRTGTRSVSFRIAAVSKADEGTYVCRARNSVGSSYKRVNVIVRDGSSIIPSDEREIRVSVWPSELNGLAGETVQLDCTSTPRNNHILRWRRIDNAPLPRTATERDGVLIIRNADSGTSGVYVCNAISGLTNNVISYAFVTVNIGELESTFQVPTLSIDPEQQTVPQGSLVVIRCTSPTNPRATVKWRKVNDEFTNHVQILGNEIRIPSAAIRDRGVYVCEYENEAGAARVSSTLEVDRREPPVIEIYPQSTQMIEVGGSTFIQCRILKGIPTPKIRWLRRGQRAFSPHVAEINGALRFTDVNEEDGGEYTCSAENAAGSTDAIAVLQIISRPIVIVSPVGPISVAVGQPIRLECTASGRPTPSVSWNQDGYQPVIRKSTASTAVFEITSAQLSDSDTYTCSATNIAGRSEERVQVFVNELAPSDRVPTPPVASTSPEEERVFSLNTDATIRCFYESSNPIEENNIFFKWEREDHSPFSNRVEERRNTLVIRQVQRQDGGKYTCLGIDSVTGHELFSKTFSLRVIGPPNITLYPVHQVVRPGDDARITCSATGDQPMTIYWSTATGEPLSRSASVDKGVLQFRGITYYDTGKYICRAQNYAGEAEAAAEVLVNQIARPASPVITAEDHYKTAIENSDMDLKCTVNSATSDYQITWRRDRSELPRTSRVVGNTLRLFSLQYEDSDRYMCQVTSPYGSSADYIDLHVERTCLTNEFRCADGTCIPESQYCDTVQHCADNTDEIDCHKHRRGIENVTIEIESSLTEPKVGDIMHLNCRVKGDTGASITWTKADGTFESNVDVSNGILKISDLQIGNAGVYRCSARTKDGVKLADYYLNIELPSTGDIYTLANVTKKSVEYGRKIELVCETNLDPPVNYSWVVHSYEKSLRKIVPNTKILSIKEASVNNSGIYFCNAVSSLATFSLPTVLTVENVIPAFSGNSYLTLPPMVHSTHRSVIEINFKPKSYDGLILFDAQRKNTKGDYISFGLYKGIPEFRYDVGSGPAIIRGDSPLKLNKWHTVVLSRNTKHGFMEINGMSNFTGLSPGKFETLDLQLPLYVGGYFNYTYISGLIELSTGFKGCINRLRVDSREFNLKKDPQEIENVENCNNCDLNPCLNHGFCQETSLSSGYICICRPGYSGENCQSKKNTCYLDSCGSGQCLENEDGIECLCPFGKTGEQCQKRIDINVPAFTKNSFLAYATPFSKKKLKLLLKLKPMGEPYVDDGIILYIAETDSGKDDFIALSIVNSFVELRFKMMDKSFNLTSNHYLTPAEYVTISLSMDSSEVIYSVAGESQIALAFNPNDGVNDLRLLTLLYIGGYDKKSILLPEEMSVRNGFHGCISTIELLGTDIGILQSYVEATNVNDCLDSFGDVCETTLPCKNGGKCLTSRNSYKCECPSDYSGANCERRKNICDISNPCKNNGTCVDYTNSYKCYCGLGFSGDHCEYKISLEKSVSLRGDGYVELDYDAINEIVHINFTTSHSNGLLFWRGQNESTDGATHHFIAIAIQNGFVQLAYQANSAGVKSISATDRRVNDAESHYVIVRRVRTQISIELDSKTTDFGEIPEQLNTYGNIYIGGLPDIRFMTGNLYSDNFNGCVQQLRINNSVIDFDQTAVSARNAAQCSNSFPDDNTV